MIEDNGQRKGMKSKELWNMNCWYLLKLYFSSTSELRTSVAVYYGSAPHKESVRSNKMAILKVAPYS